MAGLYFSITENTIIGIRGLMVLLIILNPAGKLKAFGFLSATVQVKKRILPYRVSKDASWQKTLRVKIPMEMKYFWF
jgi:hypothetical protein